MTSICRIPIQEGHPLPKLDCIVKGGFWIVQVPTDTPILESNDLCSYPRCRQRTTTGTHMQRVQYCDEHVKYSREMQKKNYANGQRKIDAGLCVRHGCRNQRAPNKKRSGLGRCCAEHAALCNEKAKIAYRNNKPDNNITGGVSTSLLSNMNGT